jgi:regulator of sigma D
MKDDLINKWLEQSQNVIVALTELCALRPFAQSSETAVKEALQEFCQILVDYVSMGHFGIYEHITQTIEFSRHPDAQIPHHLLRSILTSTAIALDFNDTYHVEQQVAGLDSALSELAEHLAQRFEWECELLNLYRAAKDQRYAAAKIA